MQHGRHQAPFADDEQADYPANMRPHRVFAPARGVARSSPADFFKEFICEAARARH
jgi:hypothetical protein